MPIDTSWVGQMKPVDVGEIFMRATALKQMNLQNKRAEMELDAYQQEKEDDQRLREARRGSFDANGNFDFVMFKNNAAKLGVNSKHWQDIEKGYAESVERLAKSRETDLANLAKQHDMFQGYTWKIMQAAPEQRPQLYKWAVEDATQKGILQPGQAPAEYPGDEQFEAMHTSLAVGSRLVNEANDRRQRDLTESQFKETQTQNAALRGKWQQEAPATVNTAEGVMQWNAGGPQSMTANTGAVNLGGTTLPGRNVQVQGPQQPGKWSRIGGLPKTSTGHGDGLPPMLMNKVTALASQFDSNPVVKNFNEQANMAESVKQIINSGLGGPGDLALVYQFMKGLDPSSVVRESEYESAAKSGNIFAGALARFNGYMNPQGGRLPDNVKQAFLQIVQQKMNVTRGQVKKMANDFGRRIEKITGRPNGKEYLTDYSTLYGDDSAGGTVRMQAPNGQMRDVPADQVEHFKSKGAKVVE
jgi:hypothetical protein